MRFSLESMFETVSGPESDAEDAGIDTALCFGCTPPEQLIDPMRRIGELAMARRLGFIFKYLSDNPQGYEQ